MSHRNRMIALSVCAAVATLLAAPSLAADTHQYYLTDMVVGSMLPQDIVGSAVPFDSPYAALSADQRALVAQDYDNLPANDEPPFPLYGVRHTIKALIPLAGLLDLSGPLVATVDVDSHGDAQSVTIFKSPDARIDRLASGALALEKYKPARCAGQPCRMQYVMRVDFVQRQGSPVRQTAFHHYEPSTGNISSW